MKAFRSEFGRIWTDKSWYCVYGIGKKQKINPDLLPIYIYDNPYTNDCEKIVTIDLHLQEIKINCRTIVLMHLREKLVSTNSSA